MAEEFGLKWDTNFETGIEEVDKQHKHLFSLIKLFADATILNNERSLIRQLFEQLEAYTVFHFSYEEKTLKDLGIASLSEEHFKEHKDLILKLDNFKKQYLIDNNINTEELIEFLVRWLIDHILETDKKEFDGK